MDETASGVLFMQPFATFAMVTDVFSRFGNRSQFIEELSKLSVLMPRHSTEDWLRTTYIILQSFA